MKAILTKALEFVKENPALIYSLILVLFIPLAFFFNNYLINSSYDRTINVITQRKAVLAEDVINTLIRGQISNDQAVQEAIDAIQQQNTEINEISLARPGDQPGQFIVAASTDHDLIGQPRADDIQQVIAWSKPEGLAFLDADDKGRFWNVTKAVLDGSGQKTGLINVSLSLSDSDAMIRSTIYRSYWILAIIVLVVLLFVSNQARLFGYALMISKLKEVDKMKDMFISMASHELRSPLTAIKGYVELIGEEEAVAKSKEASHYLANVSLSINRLTDLINDMLEVSRIEGNRIPMEIGAFDPNKLITETIEEIRPQADEKGLALNYSPPENYPQVKADASRLKQVLVNLIGNSIKYTPKGSVTVSLEQRGKEILFTIADTGIGISAEDQARLFEKFYRIQNDKTKNIIGTGLGLWITLEIIKKMGGRITVESIEGVGSHFMVYLPVAK